MAEASETGLMVKRGAQVMASLQARWGALGAARKSSLAGGLGLAVMVCAALIWYGSRPEWRVLFSGLEGRDVAQVSQELAAAGIPFQATPDGSGIEVPAESLDKARMEVAAKGMPQSGRLGFELFDKPNWVGSEFDERVNYQRALEGELEHTIATLGAVRSARVHLVLPQASLFASEQKVAKASVVLKLKRASMAQDQVDSIRNLVAGAVENLSPEQVTLVDADGRVNLASKVRMGAGGDDAEAMEARLIAMLEPLAGTGNVRATVNVSYEEGSEERTDEVYDPALTGTLSLQRSEQAGGGVRVAQGVPGTASNTPTAAPAGAVQGSEKAAAPGTPPLLQQAKAALPVFPQGGAGGGPSMKEESGTYAVSKHVVHTEAGPGRVRRVSAAVVVNDRMVMEKAGKEEQATWRPRSTEEMHRLETLAQAAVGYDEKRGDQVVLQNVSFSSNVPEAKIVGAARVMDEARSLMATQPQMLRTGVIGLLGLLLVWFVLRPVAAQTVSVLREQPALAAGRAVFTEDSRLAGDAAESLELGAKAGTRESALGFGEAGAAQRGVLEEVTRQIRRQPAQSTRLLETWITTEMEGE